MNKETMKINGKITFLVNSEYTTIEVHDTDSATTFLKIRLTPEQLASALSRLAYTECESIVVNNLDNVGKKRERKEIIQELPDNINYYQTNNPDTKKELIQFLQSKLDDGWVINDYFNSQDSFFRNEKNVMCVRCFAVRWV